LQANSPGVVLAPCTREDVDGTAGLDLREPGLSEQRDPTLRPQRSCQAYVGPSIRRRPAGSHLCELENAAQAQNTADLLEDAQPVRGQIHDSVRYDDVSPPVVHGHLLGEAFPELHMILNRESSGAPSRLGQHFGCHVDADHAAFVTDPPFGNERVEPCAAADINDAHARLQGSHQKRIADAGERFDCLIGQLINEL